ncbi:MAG: hypothetical protein GY758_20130 [Fuerstiella sp.]|nr:hypothetical protein [Fuerstiella sp.]MCP4511407.1 hypothetical protein [Fuerstiella sp.]
MSSADDSPSILKLGGSLLSLPDVGDRVVSFVDRHCIANPVVVVGGGDAADLVRGWAERFQLSDRAAHDLALRAMDTNARLLPHLNRRFELIDTPWDDGIRPAARRIGVLCCHSVLEKLEVRLPRTQHLPRSWDVTSDSIAAWFAVLWEAEHLYLLKSADMSGMAPAGRSGPGIIRQVRPHIVRSLVQHGSVDRAFEVFCAEIPRVAWCNLRGSAEEPHNI